MTIPRTAQLIAEKDGAIGWITFNNPARHNAMSMAMWEALAAVVDDYEQDGAIRVIVVKGAGEKAFVSGADISEFKEKRSSPETVATYDAAAGSASDKLHQVGKPTIAMIRGYCIGGGVGLAVSCDLRIAVEDSTFAVPAAKLGLGYEFSGVKKLVDVVGPSFARKIFYSGRQFTAAEAVTMGLVNRVLPAAELESYVRELARGIASNAPLTVMSIKTIVGEILKDEGERDMPLCRKVVERCFASADYIEGRTAFMEKRKPIFKGR